MACALRYTNRPYGQTPYYSNLWCFQISFLIIADIDAYKHLENSKNYWEKFKTLAYEGADITFIHADFKNFVGLIPDLQSLSPAEKLAKAVQNLSKRS